MRPSRVERLGASAMSRSTSCLPRAPAKVLFLCHA